MLTRRQLTLALLAAPALARAAVTEDFVFPSIDGGEIRLSDWRGKPALVVNTASQCGFTPQYDALQALHERYDGRALILAVPSDDFGQELVDEMAVMEFCEVNFSLTLPMTEITHVLGPGAHPFYAWAAARGIRPLWNFHKILVDGNGAIAADFPAPVRPDSARVTSAIEALL